MLGSMLKLNASIGNKGIKEIFIFSDCSITSSSRFLCLVTRHDACSLLPDGRENWIRHKYLTNSEEIYLRTCQRRIYLVSRVMFVTWEIVVVYTLVLMA